MRKVSYYFTQSLDGYIADADGSVSWLAGAADTDYGFDDFYRGVDTIVLGRRTYEYMLDQGDFFPYADREVLVFSSNDKLRRAADSVRIVTDDALKTVARLKLEPGKSIWLGGGARLAGSLFRAGLIDELQVFTQPIILGAGLPFLAPADKPTRTTLTLNHATTHPGAITQACYSVCKGWRNDL